MEIIAEAPEHLAQIATDKLGQVMVDGGNHFLETLTIKADAHFGNSWYSAKG